MKRSHRFANRLPLALLYFVTASLAAGLTRFDGGVAFLWVATAFLIADLMSRPRRWWIYSILPCAAASLLATGLFGLGWGLALPFAVLNMIEAIVAAWLFRRIGNSLQPLGSLSWLLHFLLAAGVVGPVIGGLLAGATLAIADGEFISTFFRFFTAHSLGNLMVAPLALLVTRRTRRRGSRDGKRPQAIESGLLLGFVVATCAVVFSQTVLPLLFLPILPVILATFRLGRGAAAAGVVLIAVIGGGATIAGLGPIQLIDSWLGSRIQFFQFYLAATVLTVLPVAADLEKRRRLHRAVRLSEQRFRLLAEHSTDVLMHLDRKARIRFASPSTERALGHDPASLIGRDGGSLVRADYGEQAIGDFREILAARGESRRFEYVCPRKDGSTGWFEVNSRAILDDEGEVDSVLMIIRDISARKATELTLTREAHTDPLTGLPNRRAFRVAVERAGTSDPTDCVALLDIDHFKQVNDRYGHAAGDEVLRGFARIARRIVREHDLVARVGGEEFAILFPETSIDQAMTICERLRTEIAGSSLRAGTAMVRVTVSGGVSALGNEGLDEALATADRALYSAKRNGRDQLAIAA